MGPELIAIRIVKDPIRNGCIAGWPRQCSKYFCIAGERTAVNRAVVEKPDIVNKLIIKVVICDVVYIASE